MPKLQAALPALIMTGAIFALDHASHKPSTGSSEMEPPLRCRVTIDGKSHDLFIGTPTRASEDQPEILVELLGTRLFEIENAFSFDFPKSWRFHGTKSSHSPRGAWWTFGGERTSIYLRRHDEDAQEILEEYVRNCEGTGATGRRAVEINLGGRTLSGYAVDVSIGGFRGMRTEAVHEIYAWSVGDDSYLMRIQKNRPQDLVPALQPTNIKLQPDGTIVFEPTPRIREEDPEWENLRTTFRWKAE